MRGAIRAHAQSSDETPRASRLSFSYTLCILILLA